MPDDLQSITPALSNFLNALTMTDLVSPTLSAILLATRYPSVPSSSLNILLIASSSEVINELVYDKVGGFVDEMLNERLLSVLSTKENVNLSTLGFTIENVKKFQALIAPAEIAGERLGTLFMYKSDSSYEIDDIILSEYGTTVVGLEMMRSVNEENAEEVRKKNILMMV